MARLLLLILAAAGVGGFVLPNPRSRPGQCGRTHATSVCDPEHEFSEPGVAAIDEAVEQLRHTDAVLSGCDALGVDVGVAVFGHLPPGALALDLAEDTFDHWGIGQRCGNGFLILVSTIDRKVEIVGGRAALDFVPAADIMDALLPGLRAGDFERGILSGVQHIGSKLRRLKAELTLEVSRPAHTTVETVVTEHEYVEPLGRQRSAAGNARSTERVAEELGNTMLVFLVFVAFAVAIVALMSCVWSMAHAVLPNPHVARQRVHIVDPTPIISQRVHIVDSPPFVRRTRSRFVDDRSTVFHDASDFGAGLGIGAGLGVLGAAAAYSTPTVVHVGAAPAPVLHRTTTIRTTTTTPTAGALPSSARVASPFEGGRADRGRGASASF